MKKKGDPKKPLMNKENKNSDRLILVLASIAGLLLSACILLSKSVYNPSAYDLLLRTGVVKRPVPDFELENLSGGTITDEQTHGGFHLIFFGDPGCPGCQASYPVLRRAQHILPVIFIGRGNRQELKDMAAKEQFSFPVVFDSLQTLSKELGISEIPSALLVDEKGVALYRGTGSDMIEALVEYSTNIQ